MGKNEKNINVCTYFCYFKQFSVSSQMTLLTFAEIFELIINLSFILKISVKFQYVFQISHKNNEKKSQLD